MCCGQMPSGRLSVVDDNTACRDSIGVISLRNTDAKFIYIYLSLTFHPEGSRPFVCSCELVPTSIA